LTTQDRDEIWDLVMASGTHGRVGLEVAGTPASCGRSSPRPVACGPRTGARAPDRLTVVERGDIVCGVAAKLSVRAIARSLGRRCRGRCAATAAGITNRPLVADQAAWDRAAKPKPESTVGPWVRGGS